MNLFVNLSVGKISCLELELKSYLADVLTGSYNAIIFTSHLYLYIPYELIMHKKLNMIVFTRKYKDHIVCCGIRDNQYMVNWIYHDWRAVITNNEVQLWQQMECNPYFRIMIKKRNINIFTACIDYIKEVIYRFIDANYMILKQEVIKLLTTWINEI